MNPDCKLAVPVIFLYLADLYYSHRSYSRLLAFEGARVLFRLGCDVRIFEAAGLPVKDDEQHDHPKVQELRDLSRWSDAHFWVSPEQHGNLVSLMPWFEDAKSGERMPNPSRQTLCTSTSDLHTDCGVQESNRLDSFEYRFHAAYARTNASYSTSLRRVAIVQRCQLPTNPRAVDAHVYHS